MSPERPSIFSMDPMSPKSSAPGFVGSAPGSGLTRCTMFCTMKLLRAEATTTSEPDSENKMRMPP